MNARGHLYAFGAWRRAAATLFSMGRALGAFRGQGTGGSEPCERQQRVREGVVTCGEQGGGQRVTQPARGTGERAHARRELETSERRCDVSTCVSPSRRQTSVQHGMKARIGRGGS